MPSHPSSSPSPSRSSSSSGLGLGPPGVVLILSGPPSTHSAAGDDEERAEAENVARAEARGELVRLRAGVHVERRAWEAVSALERHLLRIRALARVSTTPVVLGGASAAAVHGLPRIAPWPALVTLLDVPGAAPGRRAGTRVVRDPAQGRSRLVPIAGGVRAPCLAAAALAASHDAAMQAVRGAAPRGPGWYAHGLVPLDAALGAGRTTGSGCTRAELERERVLRGTGPGSRRAEALVASADGAAASAVESIARGIAHESGLARPEVGPHVPGHGRLALAWPRERVALRVRGSSVRVAPGGGEVADGPVGPASAGGGWCVVEAAERDVLGAGRLRALLLHAGLEPGRRTAHASAREAGPPWSTTGRPGARR